jgi:O-antigen/teichoic acid export membrane protein
MKEKKVLVRNIMSLGIVQVCNLVFPLITLPLIARIIGPDKFGIINYASAVIGYFTLVINYGFEMTATRVIAQSRNDQGIINKTFSDILFTKIVLLAISMVGFVILMYSLPTLRNDKTVSVYSFIICIGWVLSPNWLYQGMQDLNRIAIFNLCSKAVFTVIVLLLIKQKQDYVLQPLAFSIAQIVVSVYSFAYAFKLYKVQLTQFSWKSIRETLKEGRMIFFSMLANSVYVYTSVVILGFFRNTSEIGYYSAANRIILIALSVIFIPINQAIFPYIGSAFAKSREEGLETIRKIFPLGILISFVYGIGILLFSPLVVRIIFGPSFTSAVEILQAMAFIPLVINCGMFLGLQGLINLKMDKEYFYVILISGIFSIPLNMLLAYYWGGLGTALCWMITEVAVAIMFYLKLRRCNIHVLSRQYFSPVYLYNTVYKTVFVKKNLKILQK